MFVFLPNICSRSSCLSTLQSSLDRTLNVSPHLVPATYYAREPRDRVFSLPVLYVPRLVYILSFPMHLRFAVLARVLQYRNRLLLCVRVTHLFGGGGGRLLWYSSSRACHLQAKVVEEALPVDGLFLPRIHGTWDSHNAFVFSNGSNALHSSEEPSYTLHLRVPTRQTAMGCHSKPTFIK
jgi:hypothetical protein